MKKLKKILLLLLFISPIIWAQNGFEKGNNLYQKGKYNEAILSYESVFRTKKHSAELYYNLGNCYYKLNKVAPAIYNFEKALLLNPEDNDIKNNLKFAQKLQIDDIKTEPKVGFSKIIEDFTSMFHYNSWAGIAVAMSVLFVLLFVGFYFYESTRQKRIFFIAMFVTILAIILNIFAAFYTKSNYDNNKPAIVFAEIVALKTEPKQEATTAFELHEGTKVFVIETLDNWSKIEIADGKKGWMENQNFKSLK